LEIFGLISALGNTAFTLVAFVVALSVIVTIHEYGHYIIGRWSGIKADVFSLGFGPVLYSRVDKHGTRWQIAALPFGGYVKFKGDANAASGVDGEVMEAIPAEELRSTMHGAPLWARALTVAAGPVFNFILSLIVFSALVLFRGVASDPLSVAEISPMPGVQQLMPGDEILQIAGLDTPNLENLGEFIRDLPEENTMDYLVKRDGAEVAVRGPHPMPALAVNISPDGAALDADMKAGDVVLSVDGQSIGRFEELRTLVAAADGGSVDLELWRDGEIRSVTLTPRRRDLPQAEGGFETRWLIGINGGYFFTPQTETPGIGEALSYGVQQTSFIIRSSVSGLYHMIAGSISPCNLSGPIRIAETSGAMASQGLGDFIWFIAVLSTAVGLLNLFPIPVLDGGHLVFYAYEAVVGKPPGDKAVRILMGMGLTLILSLMVLGLGNDLFCV
jgi:regulator of sigma E protease